MPKRLPNDEMVRRAKRTRATLDQVKDELEIIIQERQRDGKTGRVTVELLTEDGQIKKARVIQESNIEPQEDT